MKHRWSTDIRFCFKIRVSSVFHPWLNLEQKNLLEPGHSDSSPQRLIFLSPIFLSCPCGGAVFTSQGVQRGT